MKKGKQLIRFDWAMKKLLRDKVNFDILEGFLSELLSEDIIIKKILESEGNKEDAIDKHNRVDVLVENEKGELIIIEVQNSKEYDYFHRILYGTSKVITEYIDEGEEYANVKKVISVTIAYFDLGQGKDYVYHGTTQFKGIHKGDTLTLSDQQIEIYDVGEVHKIYPEYWIIKVGKFNNIIQDKLDEWIYFLKNGAVKENFSAKGLSEAKKKLDAINLSEEEKIAYKYYLKRLRDIASEQHTKMIDAKKMIKEALEKAKEDSDKALEKAKKISDKALEKVKEDKKAAIDKANEDKKAAIEKVKEDKKAAIDKMNEDKKAAIDKMNEDKKAAIEKVKEDKKAAIDKMNEDKKAAIDKANEASQKAVITLFDSHVPINIIASSFGLSEEKVKAIIEEYQKKNDG